MVYLVIPDNDTTFRFLSALFFSTVFSTLTRPADVDFKGQLSIHVRSYPDEFANVGEIPDFAEQTLTVRFRNMSLVPILQNIAQLFLISETNYNSNPNYTFRKLSGVDSSLSFAYTTK